ncbi:hypothetical protein D3C84_608820 [compost metagenome]
MPLQAHGLMEGLHLDLLDVLTADLRVFDHQGGHGRQGRLGPATDRPGLEVLRVDLPALAEILPVGSHPVVFHRLGRRPGDTGLGQQQGIESGVGACAMGITQHRGMIDEPHHRTARAKVFRYAQGMPEALLVQPQQPRAATDHANARERPGGMVFGGGGHQRGAGPQRRLVADAEGAEQFLAADGPALFAAGIHQRQQGGHHGRAGMALGGEMPFMGIQAVDAEAPRPGSPQGVHRTAVEQQAAGQLSSRVMAQCVMLERLAGAVVARTGRHAQDIQQAGLQQLAGMGRCVAETEIADERIERHVDTPQTKSGRMEKGARDAGTGEGYCWVWLTWLAAEARDACSQASNCWRCAATHSLA